MRLGFRIPLSVAGPDRAAKDVAAVESRIAAEELRLIQAQLKRQVLAEAETYRTLRQKYRELQQTLDKSEPVIEVMEDALVSRRVTYFEFWSEHERFHDILIKMGESRLRAADTLGRLEILTGTEFN